MVGGVLLQTATATSTAPNPHSIRSLDVAKSQLGLQFQLINGIQFVRFSLWEPLFLTQPWPTVATVPLLTGAL